MVTVTDASRRRLPRRDSARTSRPSKGLTAAGHSTMVVADGREGGALARDDAFDLVLLDLGLPGLDGMSVLRQIHLRKLGKIGGCHRLSLLRCAARVSLTTSICCGPICVIVERCVLTMQ